MRSRVRGRVRPAETRRRLLPRAARREIIKEWSFIGDTPAEQKRLDLMDECCDFMWRPRYYGGPFDFGDEAYARRGIELAIEMAKRRYNRGQPSSPIITRQQMGLDALLYRLKAKIEIAPIAEEEVRATGWDRSAYAPA